MATVKVANLHATVGKTKQLTLPIEGTRGGVDRGTLSMSVTVRSAAVVKMLKISKNTIKSLQYYEGDNQISTQKTLDEILDCHSAICCDPKADDQGFHSQPNAAVSLRNEEDIDRSSALFSDRFQATWPITDAILVRHLCRPPPVSVQ